MQISSRFTIAVHIFACIKTFENDYKITSDFLAGSTNVNPVIIRKILGQLKGTRPLNEITLLDVYKAVECVEGGELFHFHENPNPQCPVGRSIHTVLDGKLEQVQKAMEKELNSITLEDVEMDIQKLIG